MNPNQTLDQYLLSDHDFQNFLKVELGASCPPDMERKDSGYGPSEYSEYSDCTNSDMKVEDGSPFLSTDFPLPDWELFSPHSA